MISLGEAHALDGKNSNAVKSYAKALEIVFFCFGENHYKYKLITNQIEKLGGVVPKLTKPKQSAACSFFSPFFSNLIAPHLFHPK